MIHDVDQDTGLLNAKLAHEEELENRQKSQMVSTVVSYAACVSFYLRADPESHQIV